MVSLTPVQTLDAEPLLAALQSLPADAPLSHSLNVAAAVDEAWLIEQVVRLGRRSAYERVAHLVLEMHCRLSAIDQVKNGMMSFPLTQEMLADATGLSIVHVNRTLQQLRREQFLELHHGRLTILNEAALIALSGFVEPQPGTWTTYRSCWA
jgi:CRP-like cAMP-binding protein